MEQHTIIRLTDRPEYKESMAQWFHEKWGIPKQAYLDSMDACLKGESAVPQWYAVVEDGRIIGGLGVRLIPCDAERRRENTVAV